MFETTRQIKQANWRKYCNKNKYQRLELCPSSETLGTLLQYILIYSDLPKRHDITKLDFLRN